MTCRIPSRPDATLKLLGRLTTEIPNLPCVQIEKRPVLARFGNDLLSHALRRSTIGATVLNGRVRDGIGCFTRAMITKPGENWTHETTSSATFVPVGTPHGIPSALPRVRTTGEPHPFGSRGGRCPEPSARRHPLPRARNGGRPDLYWIEIKPIGQLVPVN